MWTSCRLRQRPRSAVQAQNCARCWIGRRGGALPAPLRPFTGKARWKDWSHLSGRAETLDLDPDDCRRAHAPSGFLPLAIAAAGLALTAIGSTGDRTRCPKVEVAGESGFGFPVQHRCQMARQAAATSAAEIPPLTPVVPTPGQQPLCLSHCAAEWRNNSNRAALAMLRYSRHGLACCASRQGVMRQRILNLRKCHHLYFRPRRDCPVLWSRALALGGSPIQ